MTDFLTRLVERTLGLSPTVRPDIPPTFAPEVTEPAPRDVPGARSPTTGPGHTGAVARRSLPEPYPGPPEGAGGDAAGAGEAEHGPDVVPPHETPPSAGSRPPDGSEGEPSRGPEPPVSEDLEARWEVDRHSTVSGTDADEPPRGAARPRLSSASAPPDAAVTDTSPEVERPRMIKNDEERPEAPPSAPSTGPAEGPSGRPEPRIELDEPHDGPSRSSARLKRRPGAERWERPDPDPAPEGPGVGRSGIPAERDEPASPGRRAGDPAGAVESMAPPVEEDGPEPRAGLDRARSGAPELPASQTSRRGAPVQASGREGHEQGPDPAPEHVADPRRRRAETPVAPEDKGDQTGPLRRAVPRLPLVPTTSRPRAAPRGREVRDEVPSPTIRVTIGRVEVRAVIPSPPQPPPPQPPAMREPALSLEDYLQQHAGGRR